MSASTDFNSLPPNSKIFIYPSSRKFYKTETENLHKKLQEFVDNFKPTTSLDVFYNFFYSRFIVFAIADIDNKLTTVNIDRLFSFVMGLQTEYDITLIDKMNICFKQGEFIQYKELTDLKSLIKNKAINANTIVFDNLITTKAELTTHWQVPLCESWYERFL